MEPQRATRKVIRGLVAAALLLGGLSCTYEGSALLSLDIDEQPLGGYGVDTVFCTFTATATDPHPDNYGGLSQDIKLSAVWHSSHGTYNRSDYTLERPDQVITRTVFKAAPQGAHLDKPFWVEFYWEDAAGDHSVSSDTAICQ